MKYIILVGLPASGKTTWANEYAHKDSKSKKEIRLISCDSYTKSNHFTSKSLDEYILIVKNNISKSIYEIKEVIVDGLFTTNESVIRLIKTLNPDSNDIIEIRQWNEDREQCVLNDVKRRSIDSKVDIMNLPYEDINIDLLKKETQHRQIDKVLMNVHIKEQEIIFAESNGLSVDKKGKFTSSEWVTGGEWSNCWGDSGSVSIEEPCEFNEFDEFLERICPNITFLQYKKIKSMCVDIEEYTEYGYYGSYTEYSYYTCDIYKLYECLEELNLIN